MWTKRLGRRLQPYLKLRTISFREWWSLLRAQVSLLHARLLLSTRETGQLVALHDGSPVNGDPSRLPEAKALALAVRRAAYFGLFRPTCLVQSMALMRLLERDGLPGGRIQVGVRQRRGTMEAHAWVEFSGEVIGDFEEHISTFTELTEMQLFGDRQP